MTTDQGPTDRITAAALRDGRALRGEVTAAEHLENVLDALRERGLLERVLALEVSGTQVRLSLASVGGDIGQPVPAPVPAQRFIPGTRPPETTAEALELAGIRAHNPRLTL